MASLTSSQRSALERAVIEARRLSLKGATHALEAFAVHHSEPYSHMSAEDRALRNELRSKARLLGDKTTSDGGHTIHKIAYELAYEYWHQMLFARFLEANNLLMHPDHNIAVTLDECEELGKEEGYDNKWQAAAHYASRMLPAIFRQDDPLMQIKYATEDRIALENIIESIEPDVFTASDSIGWVYQYWQTEEKARVNESGDKITGETISAVTQLFTEPYMVHFLIDNTLGAWWTARNPGVTPPIKFEYLRTLDDGSPAAGSFDGWPDELKEVTVLEPCMGSGHFVVEIFLVMAHLRMHDEALTREQACDAVIRDNIHGLELDPRCTQIAAFNLALTAWKFCEGYRELPEMNLACCGIAPRGKKSDWIKLADTELDPTIKARLKGGLVNMYELFHQASELGSLSDPTTIERDAFTSDFTELRPFLTNALKLHEEGARSKSLEIIASGLSMSAGLLMKKYDLILTNVPYLGFKKQGDILKSFVLKNFVKSKMDLATVFIDRLLKLSKDNGIVSVVSPQNWLYLGMYEDFRERILQDYELKMVISLGSGAFKQISGEVVKCALISICKKNPSEDSIFHGLSLSTLKYTDKIRALVTDELFRQSHNAQLLNPDSRILSRDLGDSVLLNTLAISKRGIVSGDKDFWFKYFFEISRNSHWRYLQSSNESQNNYCGKSQVINWESKGIGMLRPGLDNESYGKKGIVVNQMGKLQSSLHLGEFYDNNVGVITLNNISHLKAVYAYCRSEEYNNDVREIDDSMAVTNATLIKVPFDLNRWETIGNQLYPNGLPKPYSHDPTQWLFHGHPLHTEDSLQVTIIRLLGYSWPAESDDEMELSDEAHQYIKAIHNLELPFDEDGIVCIPSVEQEAAAADRIRDNIKQIWGDDYSPDTITGLITATGSKKKDLVSYLRDDFFEHHVKLFKNRPFIWHIWDGRKDGFSALVNYHKLDRATLEKLIYTYLGDWINQCKRKLDSRVSGADGLLSAANKLKEQLMLILEAEPPYDTFIRWKSATEQSIGWNPDLNDGVRLNIQPFIKANILRKNLKTKIKVNKDRGKNPTGSHWGPERYNTYEELDDEYKLKDEDGNIIPNLTNDVKRKLREE